MSQLRERMPELNKRAKTVEAEIQSFEAGAMDEVKYLQLAENLNTFREKLQECAKTLDVRERQQILRLLVKEILVDTQSITIRHSIPLSQTENSPTPSGAPTSQPIPPGTPQSSYLLRPRSIRSVPRQPNPQGKEQHQENSRSSLISSFSPYCSLIKSTKPVSEMLARRALLSREENKRRNGFKTSQGIYAIGKAVLIVGLLLGSVL